jgi:transmembrane sensor
MNQQIYEEAAEWVVELGSSPDAQARQRFDQWLSTSPEHVRAYLECAAIRETAEAGPRATPQEIEALIERARLSSAANVIPFVAPQPSSEPVPLKRASAGTRGSWLARSSRRARFGAAAAVVLAVVGASTGYFMTHDVYATAVGEQRSILLADGSTIDLNGRSKVRVHLDNETRAVDLMEGEALFRVAADKARPFVVSANDRRVRAVGTEFAINRRQRTLLVTVVEGTVAVSMPMIPARSPTAPGGSPNNQRVAPRGAGSAVAALAPSSDEILLDAGQQLALSLAEPAAGDALPTPRAVDVDDAIAWTRRRLVFDSTPIEDVVAEFNRHSSRSLVIQGDDLRDFHISGAFSSTDVDPFVRFLRAQPGVEVIEEPDRIVIVHR